MKITIVGIGYVGLSIAKVLSKKHDVICFDVDEKKLKELDFAQKEEFEEEPFSKNFLSKAFCPKEAYLNSEVIFVCVPTNLDEYNNTLDMSCVESVIKDIIAYNKQAKVVIKSTLSMESVLILNQYMNEISVFYSPEFLRESTALYDTLHPSRIVVGYLKEQDCQEAEKIANLLKDCTLLPNVNLLVTEIRNAIAIKLFSNAYLAMRLSFFNELDSFARFYDLDASNIIDGVSLDPRIGDYYNHPSFGFKGYCLPKDTISLVKSFSKIPCALIPSILEANKKRLDYVIRDIIKIANKRKCKIVGIYRITMEKNAQSIRFSIMEDIIKALIRQRINVCVYEPLIGNKEFLGVKVVSLKELFDCDLIITNRFYDDLESVREKVFSCDSCALKK